MSTFENQFSALLDWYTERGLTHTRISGQNSLVKFEEKPKHKVIFLLDALSYASQECFEMLTKIIGAMKLLPEEFVVLEDSSWNDHHYEAHALVIFSNTNVVTQVPLIKRTHSLMQMLHTPTLKFDTWKQLQELMNQLP